MAATETTKLESTPGFLIRDLPEGEGWVGPVRLGARLLAGNALMYARSETYALALTGRHMGGATLGLKVPPEEREAAVAAAATELAGLLGGRPLMVEPGLRMTRSALGPLSEGDPRDPVRLTDREGITLADEMAGTAAARAGEILLDGLEGRRVAIEGTGPVAAGVARAVVAGGAEVVRVATAKVAVSGSFSPSSLLGPIDELGETQPGWRIWDGEDVDIVFCGSKPGVLGDAGAGALGTTPVVAYGPAAVSPKALASLNRAGVPSVPGFVCRAAAMLSWWPDDGADADSLVARAAAWTSEQVTAFGSHDKGLFLGACLTAESRMSEWAPELPFGRPMG